MWSVTIPWSGGGGGDTNMQYFHHCHTSVGQNWSKSGSGNFFLNGPNSKYFRIYGPMSKTEVAIWAPK